MLCPGSPAISLGRADGGIGTKGGTGIGGSIGTDCGSSSCAGIIGTSAQRVLCSGWLLGPGGPAISPSRVDGGIGTKGGTGISGSIGTDCSLSGCAGIGTNAGIVGAGGNGTGISSGIVASGCASSGTDAGTIGANGGCGGGFVDDGANGGTIGVDLCQVGASGISGQSAFGGCDVCRFVLLSPCVTCVGSDVVY